MELCDIYTDMTTVPAAFLSYVGYFLVWIREQNTSDASLPAGK